MRRFLLFDCDNFFVSCERVFNPSLKNRPVVVLSNNDGCVVARSNEAKAVGIAMCAPFFKIADKFKALGGVALSSNYELYADMSNRVMALLRSAFDEIEIYSIKLLATTEDSFTVEVYCSKGTYIRTLIADIGEALGCGAFVTMLRRTYVEGLPENNMISLEGLQNLADGRENPADFTELDKLLYPLELAVNNLPLISLPYNQAEPLTHGVRQKINLKNTVLPEKTDGPLQVRCKGIFIGTSMVFSGIIPWEDIKGIRQGPYLNKFRFEIILNNPGEYIKREPNFFKRAVMKLNLSLCGTPIIITTMNAKTSSDDMRKLLCG